MITVSPDGAGDPPTNPDTYQAMSIGNGEKAWFSVGRIISLSIVPTGQGTGWIETVDDA